MRRLLLIVVALICISCKKDDAFPESAGNKYDGFSTDFGTALVQTNFAKAYMMTSPEYQKTHTEQQFEDDFHKAKADLAPHATLTQVQVDHGTLPSSEHEAKETYDFPDDLIAKKSTWKNWNIAVLHDKDGNGFSVFHLVMDDGSGPKVGFIYYDR